MLIGEKEDRQRLPGNDPPNFTLAEEIHPAPHVARRRRDPESGGPGYAPIDGRQKGRLAQNEDIFRQHVREEPTRFVAKTGHAVAEIEHVVETAPDHVVIDKHGEAGKVAIELDAQADDG